MRIGFIGTGRLGVHLAGSLLRAGHELTVHDRDSAAAESLLECGAAWAASPRKVGEECESVFTCLPSPAAVASVISGESGVLEGLAPGSTWIDMSTNDRHELERLAGLAAAVGVQCLEAPVTGGVHKAAAGDITVLVGGDPEVFEAHRPLFEAMGGEIFHIGPLGSASVIKVITNMLAFVHLVATGEALMLARKAGLDLAQTYRVIEASSGTSFVHETEGQLILNGSYDIGFTMDLACKDLGLAHELGRELRSPLELAALVEQTFVRARERYGGSAQSPMVVKLLEDDLGVDLRADGFPARLEP
ncbi:MAG: NAD(P)-dependent oxidoreductase [Actinomycetota bacterium]